VAVIDDHEVVINGVKAMFTGRDDRRIVYTTTHAGSLLDFLPVNAADLLLMDPQMLFISLRTVETPRLNRCRKMAAKNTT
jgi:FixJ family two-component response regulator